MLRGIIFFVVVFFTSPAAAGHIDGNGTGGLYYSFNNYVSIYDIWEGENQEFLLGIPPNLRFQWLPSNPDYLLYQAIARIQSVAPKFGQKVKDCVYKLKDEKRFLPRGTRFSPPNDIDPTFLPEGAELIRIAAMDENDVIWIDQEQYEKMSLYQQNALYLHETTYLIQRVALDIFSTSMPSRKIVACSFAQNCSDLELKERTNAFEWEFRDPDFYLTCDRN